VLTALAALAGPARADFYSQPTLPVGESASTMGGAATAWVDDGSATWYNPAGLGRVRQQGISANLSVYGWQSVRVPDYINLDSVSAGMEGHGDIKSGAVAIFPSYLGYVLPFGNDQLRQAIGASIVIADYERFDGVLDVPDNVDQVTIHGRIRMVDQTIWVSPGWGACWDHGNFCLGASLSIGYRTEDDSAISDFNVGSSAGGANVVQRNLWIVSGAASAGLQWQISPLLRLGASVRSPARSLKAGGTFLEIDSSAMAGGIGSSVRRAEDQELTVHYRLPLQARLGTALDFGNLQLVADVIYSPAQPRFAFVRGHNGETQLPALDAAQVPQGSGIDVSDDLKRKMLVDVAIGASLQVSPVWAMRLGLFSNRSAAIDKGDDVYGDRLGMTLGITRRGQKSTKHVGLMGVIGHGSLEGVKGMESRLVETTSLAGYLNIGGTADF
jgi:hypothetical protein